MAKNLGNSKVYTQDPPQPVQIIVFIVISSLTNVRMFFQLLFFSRFSAPNFVKSRFFDTQEELEDLEKKSEICLRLIFFDEQNRNYIFL